MSAIGSAGFSLFELVFVLVIASLIVLYAVPKATDSDAFTLRSQAERFAGDLRSARFAALVGNQKLCVKTTSNSYGIYTVQQVAGTDQCTSVQWKDPVSKSPVGFSLVNGATIKPTKGATVSSPLIFQLLGVPSTGSEYELKAGGSSMRISVSEFTGHVTISAN